MKFPRASWRKTIWRRPRILWVAPWVFACFVLLALTRLQLLHEAGRVTYPHLVCLSWGLAYDAAIALLLGALLCLLGSLGLARAVPFLALLLLIALQAFQLTDALFYRFFGYHIDFKFREYMSVSNTVSIRDSIERIFHLSDVVLCVLIPVCVLAALFKWRDRFRGPDYQRNRIGWLAAGTAFAAAGVFCNYVGNIAPGNVLHDPSGLSQEPLFLLSQQALKQEEKNRKISQVDRIPSKVLQKFQSHYNLSAEWRAVSTDYPWMRAPVASKIAPRPAGKRKNVVFIFLESFGAMNVNPLTPVFHRVTPEIDRLSHAGVLFRHAYFNTNPTAPAETSVLCSVYSEGSILDDSRTSLSCLPSVLSRHGYFTNFIAGNSLNYENQYEFWRAHGFHGIIDQGSFWFPPTHPNVPDHWGKYVDGDVFDEAVRWMDSTREKPWPFFLVIKGASSHSPYPQVSAEFKSGEGLDENQKRMNGSMRYVDHELGRFIRRLSKRSYFKNTIFFIFGDHSPNEVQQWPGKVDYNSFVAHAWIPLLVLNPEKLDDEIGKPVDWVVSQVDIAPTVLDMLNITESGAFAGNSLVDQSVSPERRYAYVLDRARGRRGIITSRYAYAWDYRLRVGQLFDLSRDPFSQTNIAAREPGLAHQFKAWVRAFQYVSGWTFSHNRFLPKEDAVPL